jgi:hypothetical protein
MNRIPESNLHTTRGARPDMRSMLARLRPDAPFDRTEVWPFSGDDPRVADLTAQLAAANSTIESLNREIVSLKYDNSYYKEALDKLRKEKETSRETVHTYTDTRQEIPRPLTSDVWWATEYKVDKFIIISPDKKSAYIFSMHDQLNAFNAAMTYGTWKPIPKDHPSCRSTVECVIGCQSVSAMLKRCDIKHADGILNYKWQGIINPDSAQVQNIIVLESIQKRKEREEQLRQERIAAHDRMIAEAAERGRNVPPDKNIY